LTESEEIDHREVHWIDGVVEDLDRHGDDRLVFSTAKTPSGPIHVGVGRELIYCNVLQQLLRERGRETAFLFFVDDFDSLKSFPSGTPPEFTRHTEYLGKPLYQVPCPYGHCESWAKHYAQELLDTFPAFNINPRTFWTHEVYAGEGMKSLIRTALNRVEDLRAILRDVVGSTLDGQRLEAFQREMEGWFPCLTICENCGRLKTTKVTAYNPSTDKLTYTCSACNHTGEVKLRDWPVKLRWRIDWPAKWSLFKVSCEPAGKDHAVKGGAYDTGERIAEQVFGWKGPYRISYEWILLGERAMKTHKGISFTFAEWLAIAPPETYRYMILRESPRRHISFAPERLLQLIDEFERAERIYYNLEKPANPEEREQIERIYPISMPSGAPSTPPRHLPYRFAVILTQLTPLMGKEKVKAKSLSVLQKLYETPPTAEDAEEAEGRLKMAEYWVQNYAPPQAKIEITTTIQPEVKSRLTPEEKEGLKALATMLREKEWNEDALQYEVFELGKRLGIGTKIFTAVYLAFLGRKFGPRLASFLLSLDRDFTLRRLDEAAT